MFLNYELIVNRCTYRRGLTSQGNIACTKRLSAITSRVKVEIKIPTGRLTNLNSKTGSEVPLPFKGVLGVRHYVVCLSFNQSKQSTRDTSKNEENPKGIKNCQKRTEFGISRNTKVLGRRRVHSTAFICGKEPSGFTIGNVEFEGSTVKNQFEELNRDLKLKNKAYNLTTILSNKFFLVGCYKNVKPKSDNTTVTSGPGKETLNGISYNWFTYISKSFRNGSYRFKPLKRTSTFKPNGKRRLLTVPSLKDKIVQEGMRILLGTVFEKVFRNSSHAFRLNRSSHTALNQIRTEYKKVNWFIKGSIEKQDLNIDYNILIKVLRKRIQDEPFIDLIYKYFKVGYEKKDFSDIFLMDVNITQGELFYPVLFNIYMHSFDIWVEDILIPKYTKRMCTKSNLKHNEVNEKYERSINKTIRYFVSSDSNYDRVYYVRYANYFLVGVPGFKTVCFKIRSEIKSFLEKHLSLTLNTDKIKITHSTTNQDLFLGYHVSCVPIEKMQVKYNSRNKLVRNTTQIALNAPLKRVVKLLKKEGYLNSKNLPTRNSRTINMDLLNIIENYKSVERSILSFYAMANNYGRLAARVHYSLKYSCALTISSKMKLKTMRRVFKKYGKDLTVKVGGKLISYPKVLCNRPRFPVGINELDFDLSFRRLIQKFKRHIGN